MTEMRRRPIELADSPEHRSIPIDTFDIAEGDDNTLVIKGYASTFQPYEMYGGPANGYGWIEQIDRGAFDRTLRENPDLHLLINHEGLPLARTKSGNLFLSVDDHGLHVVAHLDRSDPDVQRLEPKMRRKDMDEMSFAFRVKGQAWQSTDEYPEDPEALRTITEVSLHKGDVSVVNWGANPTTSVSIDRALRALAECDPRELVEARSDDDVLLRAKANLANVGVLEARDESLPAAEERDILDAPTGTVIDGLISFTPEDRAYTADDVPDLIKGLDATLDEAVSLSGDADRESLPEEVAQSLDLLLAARTIAGNLMEATGTFDPDAPRSEDVDTENRDEADGVHVTLELGDTASGILATFQKRIDQLEAIIRGQAPADEEAASESEERAEEESEGSDEARDEAPKGMSLRELRVLEGIVPDDGPLSLAELRALEA